MADNIQLNLGIGGDVLAADDIGGIKHQRGKIALGADGVNKGDVHHGNPMPVTPGDSLGSDAFGRLRVSQPFTVFDSKQAYDNQPLFWDEELETGAGITSSHSAARASTILTSTLNTAGLFTRQTFQRFNYQPGKSQLILITFILDASGGGTGINRRVGLFDDNNGIFLHDAAGTINLVRRTFVSGAAVDNSVAQASWNVDAMDGSGPSGITVDWTKVQILVIDFEWLGVGRVRVGLNIDGVTYPVHVFNHANTLASVYMSTPNLPLRYQLEAAATSAASTLECICGCVMSEGGADQTGSLRYYSTAGTHIEASTADVIYAVAAIRLKSAYLGAQIEVEHVSVLGATNDNLEWLLILNPTVASAVTFSPLSNSACEVAVGNAGDPSSSTLTGGTIIDGGHITGFGAIQGAGRNAIRLGADISGGVDELYLAVRPLTAGANVEGGITWRETF